MDYLRADFSVLLYALLVGVCVLWSVLYMEFCELITLCVIYVFI